MTTPPIFRKVNPADAAGPQSVAQFRDAAACPTVDEYAETTDRPADLHPRRRGQVTVFGAQKFAVRVQADPEALAAKGLDFDDLSRPRSTPPTSTKPVGRAERPSRP